MMVLDFKVIPCNENAYAPLGKKPITLSEVGVERILNRRIVKWSSRGTTATEGSGFFCVLLEGNNKYSKEWLILTLAGSAGWLLLDGNNLDSQIERENMRGEPLFAVVSRLLGPFSLSRFFHLPL